MSKFKIFVAFLFVIAATYGVVSRVSSNITTMPWWKTGLIILISFGIVILVLSSAKRNAKKVLEKKLEKKEQKGNSNVKN